MSLETLRRQYEQEHEHNHHNHQHHHNHQPQHHEHYQHQQNNYAPYFPSFVQGFWQPDNWVHQRASDPPPHQNYHPEFHDTSWDHLHRGQRLDETNRFAEHHEVYPKPPCPQPHEQHSHNHNYNHHNNHQHHTHHQSTNHHSESGYNTCHAYKTQEEVKSSHSPQDCTRSEQNFNRQDNYDQSKPPSEVPYEPPKPEIKPFPYSSDCSKCHEELGREHDSLAYPFNKHKHEESTIKLVAHKPIRHNRKASAKPKIRKLTNTNRQGVPKYNPPTLLDGFGSVTVKSETKQTMIEIHQTKPTPPKTLDQSNSRFKTQNVSSEQKPKQTESNYQLSPKSRGLNLFVSHIALKNRQERSKYSKIIDSLHLEGLTRSQLSSLEPLHALALKFKSPRKFVKAVQELKPVPLSADSGASDLTGSSLSTTNKKSEWLPYANGYELKPYGRSRKDQSIHPVYYGFNSTIIHISRRGKKTKARQRKARELEREKLLDKQVAEATWESKAQIDQMRKEISQMGSYKGGIAGQLANLDVGNHQLCNRHTQIEAANVERMYAWERGEIDYTGSDRFANILNKLCNTLRKTGDRNLPIGLDISNR